MASLLNTHVKLLAFDFLSLTQSPSDPTTFLRDSVLPLSRIEALGTVVSLQQKPGKFLKFILDDGTGCIPCILWLNQLTSPYFAKRNPADVRLIANVAATWAQEVNIGAVVRVRGRIAGYRGALQVTVSDIVTERDPNSEILHWLDCVRLARKCYDVVGI